MSQVGVTKYCSAKIESNFGRTGERLAGLEASHPLSATRVRAARQVRPPLTPRRHAPADQSDAPQSVGIAAACPGAAE